jgi:hypothetical protein
MGKRRHTTLLISDEDRTKLEQMARDFGYVQTRGAGAGRLGSISALICAIARGNLRLVSNQPSKVPQDLESGV